MSQIVVYYFALRALSWEPNHPSALSLCVHIFWPPNNLRWSIRLSLCWLGCDGYRGQPSSLHIHYAFSNMIYNVYSNALYKNEGMPRSVKRPFPSTHTNKLLPVLTLRSITSKASLNPQTQRRSSNRRPHWSLADVSPAVSTVCCWSCYFWATTDPPCSWTFLLPKKDNSSVDREDNVGEKRESPRGQNQSNRKPWVQRPGVWTTLQTDVVDIALSQ